MTAKKEQQEETQSGPSRVTRRNFLKVGGASLAGAALLGVAGCGEQGNEGGQTGGGGGRGDISIVVVAHAAASDPFWSRFKNGVDQAAEDMGVQTEFNAPETFDIVQMRQLIDRAVSSSPDGLVVTIPDPDGLEEPIRAAIDQGIPVIAANAGRDVWQEFGVLAYVGQTEYEAGVEAGNRMADEGVTNAICINQDVGVSTLEQRCDGFTKGLGGNVQSVAVDVTNPEDAQARIENFLKQNQNVNGVLGLGSTAGEAALNALSNVDRSDQITLATFDLSPTVLKAVRDGNMLFTVDQQQYLQGYLPVVSLTLYNQYLLAPVGEVRTGPAFVTQENAKRVIQLSDQGIR